MLEALAIDAVTGLGGAARTTRVESSASPAASTGAATAPGFDTVLGQLTNEAVDTLKSGEAYSIAGLQGKASAQQVVEAVMSAERSLQLAIAVRDKVVAAYQEMSRMAI